MRTESSVKFRDATAEEIAAYKEAVKPLIGNRAAVEALRRKLGLYVYSYGIKKKVRH